MQNLWAEVRFRDNHMKASTELSRETIKTGRIRDYSLLASVALQSKQPPWVSRLFSFVLFIFLSTKG